MRGGSSPSSSWILHERARQHHWRGAGWLSIKTFKGGRGLYSIGRGKHAVSEGSYLILNENQTYEILVDSRDPVESFCVFFAPGVIEEVWRERTSSEGKLLDEPFAITEAVRFFEIVTAQWDSLSRQLELIRISHRVAEQFWLEEQLLVLADRLIQTRTEHVKQISRLNCVRQTTREELYRRVSRARDYADAMFATEVTLADLANAAALSPNHLLRSFREVFQRTPYEYVRGKRLSEAKRLLKTENVPVTEVCFAVGFESPGSFSSAFKRETGMSPSEYRERKR